MFLAAQNKQEYYVKCIAYRLIILPTIHPPIIYTAYQTGSGEAGINPS